MDAFAAELQRAREGSRRLDIMAARASAAELGRHVFPGWVSCWYHDVMADHLNACLRYVRGLSGGIRRVAIACPFQHQKSTMIEMFVAQALGIDPSLRIVNATYNVTFARERIDHVQRWMSAPFYQQAFATRFGQASAVEDDDGGKRARKSDRVQDKVRNTANMFQVRRVVEGRTENAGGSFLSTSLGAGLNGRPYDIGIIDDPYRDEEMAASEVERRHIEERYDSIFESRETARSIQVFVFTRMGPDDLMGYALPRWEKAGIPHAVLRFPAILDEPPAEYDPRPQGWGLSQALVEGGPEIKPGAWYEEKRRLIQPWTWETSWQQRPTTRAGDFFQRGWWRTFDPADLGSVDRYWVSIDCAMKASGPSWTCADLWAAKGPMAFKIDELRGHWDVRHFERELLTWITHKWGREVRGCGSSILIEDGGYGRYIHDDLVAAGVHGAHLLPTGGLSKTARASMVLDFVRSGLAHLPARSSGRVSQGWVEDHISEYGRFPQLPCDRVDAGVQALRWHLQTLRGET
ncbi:MAG: hypothetical protein E6Q97_37760 [Desulfurellales bacterium]|nr:MAG: hypothetical protein E6Q97_37760 [Desulfurellales bacterium]